MTWETGKGSSSEPSADSLVAATDTAEPGKRTKTEGVTGIDDYVDHGAACDEKDGPDCFPDDIRHRVLEVFRERVSNALGAFRDACTRVELYELTKKEPNVNILLMIAVGAVGGYLVAEIGEGVAALQEAMAASKASEKTLENVLGGKHFARQVSPVSLGVAEFKPSSMDKIKSAFANMNPKSLEKKIDKYVDKAPETINKGVEKVDKKHNEGEKQEALSFLDQLRSKGESMFNSLMENLPGQARDAELAAVTKAFEPERHHSNDYVRAIQKEMASYKESGVTSIGTNTVEQDMNDGKGPRGRTDRDVKVQWRSYLSGYPNQLTFVHQDERHDNNGTRKLEPAAGLDDDPRGVYIVPENFVNVAIARHVEAWGTQPETIVVDDSGPAYMTDPKRQLAAKTQKAVIARAQVQAEHAANLALSHQAAVQNAKKMGPDLQVDPGALKLNTTEPGVPQHDPSGDAFK